MSLVMRRVARTGSSSVPLAHIHAMSPDAKARKAQVSLPLPRLQTSVMWFSESVATVSPLCEKNYSSAILTILGELCQ